MGDNRPYIAVRTYADLIELLREEAAAVAFSGERFRLLRVAQHSVEDASQAQPDRNLASLPEDDGSW